MGGSTIELSLEETNKLRAKLGLKPLVVTVEDPEGEEGAIQEDEPPPLTEKLKEDIAVEPLNEDFVADGDEDDELLDPRAWVEMMRRREREQQMTKKRKREKETKSKAQAPEVAFKHQIDLKDGESVTLTMSDQKILDERGQIQNEDDDTVTLEDVRAAELLQYKRNVKERRKIQELQASIGPAGISSKTFDEEMEEEVEDLNKGARLESDETDLTLQAADPPPVQPVKPKFKSRQPTKAAKSINWDEILGSSTQDRSQPSTRAEEDLFKAPKKWSLVGQDETADDLEANLLSQAIQEAALKPVSVKAEAEAVSSILLIDRIKEEKPNADTLEDVDMKPEIKLGTIDADLGESAASMTSTSEFAKSLLTPLDRIEERRSALNERRLRGLNVSVSSTGGNGEDFDVTKVPELNLEEVLDPKGLDGGLVSALEFLKKKGDINADRWNLGRVGREKRIPLHKGTADDDIKIDYVDKWGNVQNPKDAFRDMSYHFHGKGPGRKKQEKKLKKMELDHRVKTGLPGEVLPTMRALQIQNAKGEAGLILSSTDNRH